MTDFYKHYRDSLSLHKPPVSSAFWLLITPLNCIIHHISSSEYQSINQAFQTTLYSYFSEASSLSTLLLKLHARTLRGMLAHRPSGFSAASRRFHCHYNKSFNINLVYPTSSYDSSLNNCCTHIIHNPIAASVKCKNHLHFLFMFCL